MTIKTICICDGCDTEYSGDNPNHVTRDVEVSISLGGTIAHSFKADLCSGCLGRVREKANPKNWPRMAKDAPRAPKAA